MRQDIDSIADMFDAQAARTPDTLALVHDQTRYTYSKLKTMTDQIAGRLQGAGIGPEKIVGCHMRSSLHTAISILGILKAGGAYMLLDHNLPSERLKFMLQDAKPSIVLTDSAIETLESIPTLHLDEALGETPDHQLTKPSITDETLAYISYTSGSTGEPKGVLTTHGATTNHVVAFNKLFKLRPSDRVPLMAPVSFDVATEEILPPLVAGCTLVDSSANCDSMKDLTNEVMHNNYTILNLPAPLWHRWTAYLHDSSLPIPNGLRLVIVGSEKIYTGMYRSWLKLSGADKVEWVAAYGTTETAVTSTVYRPKPSDNLDSEALMPIGAPLAGVELYILGDDGKPVAEDAIGEIYIGGKGVARGYQNLPDKTMESFVLDPFANKKGARMYRTGDLARRHNGLVFWIGRKDLQMKINGFRIEPGEIEAVIHLDNQVREVVVTLESQEDEDILIAHVETKNNKPLNRKTLRQNLRAHLSPIMIPKRIVQVPHIPLKTNGKIDIRSLTESKS